MYGSYSRYIIFSYYSNPYQPMDNQIHTPTNPHTSPPNNPNLLIGVTGSVAAIKLSVLLDELVPYFNIRVIVTQHGRKFMDNQENFVNKYRNFMYYDQMEWEMWRNRGDPVLHIQLRKWADYMLIAPLSANTLAKISNGLCDNLLTLVCRAWPFQKKQQANSSKLLIKNPIIVCPSMNTMMWDHPITQAQLNVLRSWGYEILGPVSKKMMCGDIGNGAMSEVKDIVAYMLQKLEVRQKATE